MWLKVVMGWFCFSCALYAIPQSEQQEIKLRIQPVGQVKVQNQPQIEKNVSGQVEIKKELGKEIYEQFCIVCHRDGLAGAPKFRNQQDWKPRLVGRTLDDLVESSIKGMRAMPAKGTCIKCSKDDLKAAISYMLPKS